ncbi:MAG: hypothetical protein ACRYG2_20365, partial [Janthinobacterium lividum]
ELLHRGVVRSRNAPAGDFAEHLALIVYGGELAPTVGEELRPARQGRPARSGQVPSGQAKAIRR